MSKPKVTRWTLATAAVVIVGRRARLGKRITCLPSNHINPGKMAERWANDIEICKPVHKSHRCVQDRTLRLILDSKKRLSGLSNGFIQSINLLSAFTPIQSSSHFAYAMGLSRAWTPTVNGAHKNIK
ncbi:hypothetical protein DL93DRAFT_136242 [Clavulina sp. PMI_390]|nr:hypothetical protein DL93DRAFT_136242 [Clavulina sp. PMI_390]